MLAKQLDLKLPASISGPLGGDMQIGAKITEGDIDFLIFFWDPLEPQPHDPDIKALLRLAVLTEYTDCLQPRHGRLLDFLSVNG